MSEMRWPWEKSRYERHQDLVLKMWPLWDGDREMQKAIVSGLLESDMVLFRRGYRRGQTPGDTVMPTP
jgi:hypothetical protein